MTVFIGLAVIALGLNAFFNQNVSVAMRKPARPPGDCGSIDNPGLQATISQYQQRGDQYQGSYSKPPIRSTSSASKTAISAVNHGIAKRWHYPDHS